MRQSLTEQALQQGEDVVATFQAYLTWLEERDAVQDSYERWAGGSSWGAALAFGAFRDALDREERAAHVYETVVRQVAAAPSAAEPVSRSRASTQKSRSHDRRDARPNAA